MARNRNNDDHIANAVAEEDSIMSRASLDDRLRREKEDVFEEIIINSPTVNLRDLRRLSWHGVPDKFRADVWQLLLGYVPTKASRRTEARRKKRKEYSRALEQHFFSGLDHPSSSDLSSQNTNETDEGSHGSHIEEKGNITELGSLQSDSSHPSAVAATDEEEGVDDTASVSSSDSSVFSTADALMDSLFPNSNTNSAAANIPTPLTTQIRRMSQPFSWKNENDADGNNSRGGIYRQIRLDVDRCAGRPHILSQHRIRTRLCRALFLWSVRHPACSYVQGMHDVAATLFIVFLSGYIGNSAILDEKFTDNNHASSTSSLHLDDVPDQLLDAVEADAYWCLTNLMWSIQDHYTADQPGLQRMVLLLEDLVCRLDPALARHLKKERMEFMWFAFRWMNCLLARDLNWRCLTRMWDTCLSEDSGGRSSVSDTEADEPTSSGVQVCVPSWDGFHYFHVYVCVALLHRFSDELQTMEFEDLFYFLQNLPTKYWDVKEMEQLLSQAYAWRATFREYEDRIVSGKRDTDKTTDFTPANQRNDGQLSISYSPPATEKKISTLEEKQPKKAFSSFLGKINSSLTHLNVESEQYSADYYVWPDF